ncbi:hypothetical protein [Paucilactobacillus kaifaensis]|uniref:hypothetical protein n=1 Tax=Paucilactobacillus kaifaensis TaxID=2559921 RepID=UPI0010F5F533|nr:hypothetical protein [Paucilactobacillus kaifaensis]
MSELHLSVSSSDDVDEIYFNEQIESVDLATSQSTSFFLTDEEALKMYHFIRSCLLLENKINITVTDQDGMVGRADEIKKITFKDKAEAVQDD